MEVPLCPSLDDCTHRSRLSDRQHKIKKYPRTHYVQNLTAGRITREEKSAKATLTEWQVNATVRNAVIISEIGSDTLDQKVTMSYIHMGR